MSQQTLSHFEPTQDDSLGFDINPPLPPFPRYSSCWWALITETKLRSQPEYSSVHCFATEGEAIVLYNRQKAHIVAVRLTHTVHIFIVFILTALKLKPKAMVKGYRAMTSVPSSVDCANGLLFTR